MTLGHLPCQLLARAPDPADDNAADQQCHGDGAKPGGVAHARLLHDEQAAPSLVKFVNLGAGQGHQVAIHHPGQFGLVSVDGKAKAEAIFQLLDIEPFQQVGTLGILQLIKLAQHGVSLALFDRCKPLLEAVGANPLLITEQGEQGGIVEGFRYQNTLPLELGDAIGSQLALADQGKPVGGDRPAENELIRQCRGLRQAGHHIRLTTAQLFYGLRLADGRHQLVFQAGLLGDPAQHIRAPPFRLPQIIDAAIGHQLGIDHQANGATAAG